MIIHPVGFSLRRVKERIASLTRQKELGYTGWASAGLPARGQLNCKAILAAGRVDSIQPLTGETYQRLKAYLKRHKVKQKDFVIGLVEAAMEKEANSVPEGDSE